MADTSRQHQRVRRAGERKEPRRRGGKGLLDHSLGIHAHAVGEGRVNLQQQHAIANLYATHPAMTAARTVLLGQMLSGGLQVTRGGEVADLKPAFKRHLERHWLPFARDVIDSFLMWGFCVSIFEEEETEDALRRAAKKARREVSLKKEKVDKEIGNIVPRVPDLGTYEVAWNSGGRLGYIRDYYVYSNAPGHATSTDDEAFVHIRQAPDMQGNIVSPIASIFELGSFVNALTELAFTAEVARSTPSIVTQVRKPEKGQALDTGALFFDSESRNVAAGQDAEESQQAARTLELQARLAKEINKVQQWDRGTPDPRHSEPGRSVVPPDIMPKLFTLPKDQELAPHVQAPQPRGDLGPLTELSIQQFSAALGVPASLIFEGKFAGKSTQQLQLLNSTVSQLAKAVNQVLTSVYTALYGEDNETEPQRLQLRTAPLAAAEEVEKLYTAGVLDCKFAVPATLHALGVSPEEIDKAVEEACEKREKEEKVLDDERKKADEEQKLNHEERKVGMEATKAQTEVTKKEAKGMVKPTAASSSTGK
jgi:hypothetical protein